MKTIQQWVLARHQHRGLGAAKNTLVGRGSRDASLHEKCNQRQAMKNGDVIVGHGIGCAGYDSGDIVQRKLGWREYAVIDSDPCYLPLKMKQMDLEDILGDIKNMPAALVALCKGDNAGVRTAKVDTGCQCREPVQAAAITQK